MALTIALTGDLPACGFILLGPGGPDIANLDHWRALIEKAQGKKLRGVILMGEADDDIHVTKSKSWLNCSTRMTSPACSRPSRSGARLPAKLYRGRRGDQVHSRRLTSSYPCREPACWLFWVKLLPSLLCIKPRFVLSYY